MKSKDITLVGMSNDGKSHMAKALEGCGWRRICIDDLIAAKLRPILQEAGFSGDIRDVAKWMGLPYEVRSPENQRLYLECENQAMLEALASLDDQPTIIDSTGSFGQTDTEVQAVVKLKTRIIYMRGAKHSRIERLQRFFAEPKPVVFGELYTRLPGESVDDSMARSYAELDKARGKWFETMADFIYSPVDVFLQAISR